MIDECLVRSKESGAIVWQQLSCNPSCHNHYCCSKHCQSYYVYESAMELCTIIISSNGLQSLLDSHNNHHKDKGNSISDSIGSNGHIPTVAYQCCIDEDNHNTSTSIHGERRNTNSQNILDDIRSQPICSL